MSITPWMEKIGRPQYLPLWIAGGVLLIVVELVALGWVAKGQVERSNRQQADASALRVRLWGCLDAGAGPQVDRCRADVMASARGEMPAVSTLATYVPDTRDLAVYSARAVSGNGLVPVSLVQGGLR